MSFRILDAKEVYSDITKTPIFLSTTEVAGKTFVDLKKNSEATRVVVDGANEMMIKHDKALEEIRDLQMANGGGRIGGGGVGQRRVGLLEPTLMRPDRVEQGIGFRQGRAPRRSTTNRRQ